MGTRQLELAYDALDRFEPRVLNCDDKNYVDWRNDVKELIRLAAEFRTAFGGVDEKNEMSRREELLAEITGKGSTYDAVRRGVIPIIRAVSKQSKTQSELEDRWGVIDNGEMSFALFPLGFEASLSVADGLLSQLKGEPERELVVRWRDQLVRVERVCDREHLWGTFLIVLCTAVFDPDCADIFDRDGMDQVLLVFRQLHKVATAIRSAARSLYAVAPALDNDPAKPESKTAGGPTHSNDFRSVNWGGRTYNFTPNQAAVIKLLWEHWERNTPDVGGHTLIEAAEISCKRLDLVFRGSPAWKTMVVASEKKGAYRLDDAVFATAKLPAAAIPKPEKKEKKSRRGAKKRV